VFSPAASAAVEAMGYPSLVSGPGARTRKSPNQQGSLPGRRRILKGEIRPNLTNSGLVIATSYPVVSSGSVAYARGSCAGFDCLSNKGALFAEIAIPGVPGAIDLYTTHMQSQGSSRVPVERHSEAHRRQAQELSVFAESTGNLSYPTIMAGDFNLRNSDVRYYGFERRFPLQNVHRFCTERPDECDVRQDWEHADQWRREQNLQLFLPGQFVSVRPIRAQGMFDGGPGGPILSDHVGFRVTYELTWATRDAPPPVCPIGAAVRGGRDESVHIGRTEGASPGAVRT
jgi:endonuclease/exonuclease/phosphatase family metal-dependent hydrolase